MDGISEITMFRQEELAFSCTFLSKEEYTDLIQFDNTKEAVDQVISFAEEAIGQLQNKSIAQLEDHTLVTEKQMNTYENLHHSLNYEKTSLQQNMEEERQKLSNAMRESSSLRSDKMVLEEKLRNKDLELMRYKKLNEEHNDKMMQLQTVLNNRERELSNTKELVERKDREYNKVLEEKSSLERKFLSMQSSSGGYNPESVQKQILENDNANLKSQIKFLQGELENRMKNYSTKLTEVSQTKTDIESRENTFKRQTELLKMQVQQLEEDLRKANEEVQVQYRSTRLIRDEKLLLERRLEEMKMFDDQKNVKFDGDHKNLLEDMQKSRTELQRALQESRQRLKPLEDELERYKSEYTAVKMELERTKQRLHMNPTEKVRDIFSSSIANPEALYKIKELESNLLIVKNERDVAKRKIDEITRDIQEKFPIIQKQKVDYEKMCTAHAEISKKYHTLMRQFSDVEKSDTSLTRELESIRIERNTLKKENESLSKYVHELAADLNKVKVGGQHKSSIGVSNLSYGTPLISTSQDKTTGVDRILEDNKKLHREKEEWKDRAENIERKAVQQVTSQFQVQYKEAVDRINHCVKEKEEDKQKLLKLKSERDTYYTLVKDLQRRFNISDNSLGNLNRSLEKDAFSQEKDMKEDFKILLDQYKTEKNKAQTDYFNEYKSRLEVQSEYAKLKALYEDANTKLNVKESDMLRYKGESENFRAQTDKYISQIRQLENEVSQVRTKLDLARSDKLDAEKQRDQKQNMMQFLQETNKKLTEDNTRNQSQIVQLNSIVEKLNSIQDVARKENMATMTYGTQIENLNYQLKKLMAELENERSISEQYKKQLDLHDLSSSLYKNDSEEVRGLSSKVVALELENKSLRDQIGEKEQRLTTLMDRQMNMMRNDSTNVQIELDRVTDDYELTKGLLEQEKQQSESIVSAYQELKESYEDLRTEFEEYQAMSNTQLDEKETDVSRFKDSKDLVIKVELENQSLHDQMDEMKQTFDQEKATLENEIQQLKDTKSHLEEKIHGMSNTLNQSVESYQKAEQQYNDEVARHAHTLESLKSDRKIYLETTQKLLDCERRMQDLENQTFQKEKQTNEVESKLKQEISSYRDEINSLTRQNSLIQSQLEVSALKIERLLNGESEFTSTGEQEAEMYRLEVRKVQRLTTEVGRLKSLLQGEEQRVTLYQERCSELEVENKNARVSIHLEERIAHLEDQLKLYKDSRVQLVQDNDRMVMILNTKDKEISDHRTKEYNLQKELTELKINLQDYKNENNSLQERLQNSQARIQKLLDDFRKMGSEETKKLQEQINTVENEKDTLQQRILTVQQLYQSSQNEKSKILSELIESKDTIESLRGELETATAHSTSEPGKPLEGEELATLEALKEDWSESMTTYKKNIDKARATIGKWNTIAKEAQAEIVQLSDEIKTLQEGKNDLESRLERAEQERLELKGQLSSFIERQLRDTFTPTEKDPVQESQSWELGPSQPEHHLELPKVVEDPFSPSKRDREEKDDGLEPPKMQKLEDDEEDSEGQDDEEDEEDGSEKDEDDEDLEEEKIEKVEEKTVSEPTFAFGDEKSNSGFAFGAPEPESQPDVTVTPLELPPVSNDFTHFAFEPKSTIEEEAPKQQFVLPETPVVPPTPIGFDLPVTSDNFPSTEESPPLQRRTRRMLKRGIQKDKAE